MEGLPSISWKERNLIWRFWPDLTPWFWCLVSITILLRLEIFSSYQFNLYADFVKIQLIFTNLSITTNWKLELNSNLCRIVMGIKHQNQGNISGQNCPKKFCSFQLMEGNPSISWKYFHRLEAFHLLAFGYNWFIAIWIFEPFWRGRLGGKNLE